MLAAGVLIAIQSALNLVGDYRKGPGQLQWGISFSSKQAHHLGLDSRQVLTALLDELGARRLRLMSYWDEIEPQRGQYDFQELDWQIKEASKRGAEVSLAIGLRQPRWPECHYPQWVGSLPVEEQFEAQKTFVTEVVKRYRHESTVKSWQLENEALNKGFGLCTTFDRGRLQEEFNLVKQLDPGRPIILSLSDEAGLPLRQPRGDLIGFSVYGRYYYSGSLGNRYITYPLPAWFHTLKAALARQWLGRESIIHELQAEPWGPKAIPELSPAEQDETMSLGRFEGMTEYARKIGVKDVYLWGAEWWYWRREAGDPRFWQQAQGLFSD